MGNVHQRRNHAVREKRGVMWRTGKLNDVLIKVESIECKMCVFDELRKRFECCICYLSCLMPTLAPCCGRIVGCSACIEHWITNQSRCPLCSVNGTVAQLFHLKGFEEVTSFSRMLDCPGTQPTPSQLNLKSECNICF